jgi:hypothetical protein
LYDPIQRERRHPPGIVIGIAKPLPGAVVVGHIPRRIIGKAACSPGPKGDGLQAVAGGGVAIGVRQRPGAGVQHLRDAVPNPVIGIADAAIRPGRRGQMLAPRGAEDLVVQSGLGVGDRGASAGPAPLQA